MPRERAMVLAKQRPGFGKKPPSSSSLARAVKRVLKQELKDDDLVASASAPQPREQRGHALGRPEGH